MKLLIIAVVAALVVWPAAAGAQEPTIPPCSPEWEAQHEPAYEAGTEARYAGRRPILELAAGRSGITWETEDPVGYEGETAARSKLFSPTYDVRRRGRKVRGGSLGKTIRLPHRVGVYVVAATWAESAYLLEPLPPKPVEPPFGATADQWSAYWDALHDYENPDTILSAPCLRTAALRVRVIRGALPHVRVKRNDYLDGSVRFIIKQRGSDTGCETTRKGLLRLVVQGPDARRVLRLSDTCGRWSRTKQALGWRVRPLVTYRYFQPRAEAVFVPRFKTAGARDFSYRLSIKGRAFVRGSFKTVVTYQ